MFGLLSLMQRREPSAEYRGTDQVLCGSGILIRRRFTLPTGASDPNVNIALAKLHVFYLRWRGGAEGMSAAVRLFPPAGLRNTVRKNASGRFLQKKKQRERERVSSSTLLGKV